MLQGALHDVVAVGVERKLHHARPQRTCDYRRLGVCAAQLVRFGGDAGQLTWNSMGEESNKRETDEEDARYKTPTAKQETHILEEEVRNLWINAREGRYDRGYGDRKRCPSNG